MGAVQSDHSKSYTLYIKIPDPFVTFSHFPYNEYNFDDLQNSIQYIVQSSILNRPSDYDMIVQKVFAFVENSQSVTREKILMQSNRIEFKDADNQLTELARQTATLNRSFQILLQYGISKDDRATSAVDEGLSACQNILRYFADENGIFSRNFFITSPCLVACAGLMQSFAKNWLDDDQRVTLKELASTTVHQFKEKCIQERLGNIKMLRSHNVSYNVHDYSYEAQVRKDVTFGGKINDFYDKRTTNEITYRDYPLRQVSDAELILDEYKNDVKGKYEQFFDASC